MLSPTMTRGSDWTQLNSMLHAQGAGQNGQMNTFQYKGKTWTLIEAEMNVTDFGSFRLFLYNETDNVLQKLNITTPGGSQAIANPRIALMYDSMSNAYTILGTYALLYASDPGCPGTGEGGTFLFKTDLDSALVEGALAFSTFNWGYYPMNVLMAKTDLMMGSVGYLEMDGVATSAGRGQGHMVYGPYLTTLPGLTLTAVFKVMIDSVSSANDIVAQIEVADATANQVIASKQLHRGDFDHAYNYDDFRLDFCKKASLLRRRNPFTRIRVLRQAWRLASPDFAFKLLSRSRHTWKFHEMNFSIVEIGFMAM